MNEYTKGGWVRKGNKIGVSGRGTIAKCPSPTTEDGVTEFMANAQLIASAPALYEALKEMIENINSYLARDKGKQALAKAEK